MEQRDEHGAYVLWKGGKIYRHESESGEYYTIQRPGGKYAEDHFATFDQAKKAITTKTDLGPESGHWYFR
jgi:hypothetical protein